MDPGYAFSSRGTSSDPTIPVPPVMKKFSAIPWFDFDWIASHKALAMTVIAGAPRRHCGRTAPVIAGAPRLSLWAHRAVIAGAPRRHCVY